jgi:hypothetical protein
VLSFPCRAPHVRDPYTRTSQFRHNFYISEEKFRKRKFVSKRYRKILKKREEGKKEDLGPVISTGRTKMP